MTDRLLVRAGHALEILATQHPWSAGRRLPSSATLRQWRLRGVLATHGRDTRGNHLYDVVEVRNAALRHEESP